MPRSKNYRKPKTEHIPAEADAIAELHALVDESQNLAYQLNFPITNVSLSLLLYFIFSQIAKEEVAESAKAILTSFAEEAPIPTYAFLFSLVALNFFGFYKLFHASNRAITAALPQGLGFKREPHEAYKLEHQMISAADTDRLKKSLTTLIKQQQRLNRSALLTYLSTFFMPIVGSFISTGANFITLGFEEGDDGRVYLKSDLNMNFRFNSPDIALYTGTFGAGLVLDTGDDSASTQLLRRIAINQQSLMFYQFIYRRWQTYNQDNQLNTFKSQLNALTKLQGASWKILSSLQNSFACVFSLTMTKKQLSNNLYLASADQSLYIPVLQRVLRSENLPVYATQDNQIYVGFRHLSSSKIKRLQNRFQRALVEVEGFIQQHEQTLAHLTKLNQTLRIVQQWDAMIDYHQDNGYEAIYYCQRSPLSKHQREVYEKILADTFGPQALTQDDELLNLTGNMDIRQFNIAMAAFDRDSYFQTEKSHDFHSIHTADEPVNTIPRPSKRESKAIDKVTSSSPQKSLAEKPKPYQFACGIRFFANPTKPGNHQKQRAFPIAMPHIKPGHAFAYIDDRVIDASSQLISEEQILARLDRGEVHGVKSSKHSKKGAEGIQLVSPSLPYTDVDNQQQESNLKLKFTNNLGIFGRKQEHLNTEDGVFTLYRFDGPVGYRH